MDPSPKPFLEIFKLFVAAMGFGSAILRLFFYLRPPGSQDRPPLRWAMTRLIVNLGWGTGWALLVLSRDPLIMWVGTGILIIFGVLEVWVVSAEERAGLQRGPTEVAPLDR